MSSKRLHLFRNPVLYAKYFGGPFHNIYYWQEFGKRSRIYLIKTKILTQLPIVFFAKAQSFFRKVHP